MAESLTFPPALVFGSSFTVLGTTRLLGRKGVTVYCLSDGLGYLGTSRWCHTLDKVPKAKEFSSLTEILSHVSLPKAVLFPCSDHWVSEMAHLDKRFQAQFPAVAPPAATVDTLLNKGRLAEALTRFQFPAPLTMPVRCDADLEKWPTERWPNAVLKPCDSQKFMSIFYRKALRVTSLEQCRQRLAKVMKHDIDLVLQEYIPGPATRHYFIDGFVDSQGVVRAQFARQRLRMYPLDFGDSSCLRSIELSVLGDLPGQLTDLLKKLNYRGIFSAEFKFDERDKQYKLLEINVRPWVYIGYAADCGVDVANMAYRDAIGQEIKTVETYRVGVGLITINKDRRALWAGFKHWRFPIWHWFWSWIFFNKTVFSWDDPVPFLAHYWQRFGPSRDHSSVSPPSAT